MSEADLIGVPVGSLGREELTLGPGVPGVIRFCGESTELLRLEASGDIYVRGKLTENDKEVVDGLREFIAAAKVHR